MSRRGVWPRNLEKFSDFFGEVTQQRCKEIEPFIALVAHTHTPSSAHTRQNTHLSLKGKEAALHLCLRALKALNVASLPGLSPALSCAVNTHYDTGNPSSGNTQLSPMLQHSLGNTEEFLFRVPGLSILSTRMFSTVSI